MCAWQAIFQTFAVIAKSLKTSSSAPTDIRASGARASKTSCLEGSRRHPESVRDGHAVLTRIVRGL